MRRALVVGVVGAAFGVACTSSSPTSSEGAERHGSTRQQLAANIHPASIQIDGQAAGADLFRDAGTPLNAGATADWVVDALPNAGTSCLGADGIATCVEPNVTGATGGTGHWNGARIVDGIGGDDQDIFRTGGKENDTTTWNIGAGTVGSSKYDMVQAYLANNQTQLFFGMERRGNNGTTAFDFEFNQAAPKSLPGCSQLDNVPCRSVGDVLFTFEMQGSGSSGSAVPSVFTWTGSEYGAGPTDAGILSSINNSATTKGGPWGHVDSHGAWVLGDLDRFTFAEAVAPLSLLPGVNACGGSAYVQVRTRSSSTATSDLKDTSKIFEFTFAGLRGSAVLLPSCDPGFSFDAGVVNLDGTSITNATCVWTFSDGQTRNACAGFLDAGVGTYAASVVVTDPNNVDCAVDIDAGTIASRAPLAVSPSMAATCSLSFTYDAGVSGGANPGSVPVAWTFTGGTTTPSSSTSRSGSVTVGAGNVLYTGSITATETRDGLTCTATASATARPFGPLAIDLALQPSVPQCQADGGMTDDAVTYTASPSGGNGSYSVIWNGPTCSGSTCTIDPAPTTYCAATSLSATVSDTSNLCPPV
ncbi:MAG TPA: hypothetical protein VGE37_06820, partial [Archangium sp.]